MVDDTPKRSPGGETKCRGSFGGFVSLLVGHKYAIMSPNAALTHPTSS